ncbi:MAG: PEP-CTERM sorting domain-containing protein [Planctomycetales bacterium]|nr:PEP-CTERM sorting domain-containing protein [Planctomycetales bacterium]
MSYHIKTAFAALACLALLEGSVYATTLGFVGAAERNQAIPVNYGSNISADGAGWTVSDGTGATPNIALDWGNNTAWAWEFHDADTFQHLESLHASGAWDAANPPTSNAVAQLQSDQPNGRLELNFSVYPGTQLVLRSLDIGNATDQLPAEGPYGFDMALVKDSDSSVVWTHTTPEFNPGEQQAVTVNFTGDLGEDYTLTFTRQGQGSGATFRSGLDNLSFSQIVDPSAPQFLLTVDRNTGGIALTNTGAASTTIKGYSITSEVGGLNYSGWKPIAGNYDMGGNQSVDGNDDWTALSQPGANTELSEFEFGGDGGVLGAGASVVLNQATGNAWLKSPFEDLTLDVVLASGEILSYNVEYINGPAGGFAYGDFNFDGTISTLDWPIYNAGRGVDLSGMTQAEAYRMGDLDGDFDNDLVDFLLFKENFIGVNGQGTWNALFSAPEPSAVAILLTTLGLLCSRRTSNRIRTATLETTNRRSSPVKRPYTVFLVAAGLFVALAESAQATTIGFVGAAGVNQDIPLDYGSNVTGDNTGWTTSDGSGATPDVSLYWGGVPGGDSWDWEFHNAGTFQFLEAPHVGGAWDALNPPTSNAVVQLQSQSGGQHELNFSVPSGITFILDSFDIGNATDQTAGEGPYGFDLALIRDSDSSQVWSHSTPEFNAGEQESVSVNFTGSPGEDYTLTFARHGQGNGVTWRSGLDNLRFSQTPGGITGSLRLVVNTVGGGVTLVNDSGVGVAIDSYEIVSDSGSLDPSGWFSLQDQDYEGNGTPGSGDGWEIAGGTSQKQLIESYLLGDSMIPNGASIPLGSAFDFDKLGVQQDLGFSYHVAGVGAVLTPGEVEFVTIAIDGDYNSNGIVDAADYTVWRDTLGSTTDLRADGNGNNQVDAGDYGYWRARYGSTAAIAAAPIAGVAAPEPGSLGILVLGLVGLAVRRSRSTRLPIVLTALVAVVAAQPVSAAKTNDRLYEFGDGGSSITQDSQFVSANDKQDLSTPSGLGTPASVNVSSSGLNRPGTATGDTGAQFDGLNDVLSTEFPLNRPDETAGPDPLSPISPLIQSFPFNYNSIVARGLQMWVYPDASAIGAGRQGIVFDTRAAGGVSISADGNWTQSFAGVTSDGDIEARVPVVGNQWHHVMHHIYHSTQPGFPTVQSNGRAFAGIVYVDGVAVSASNSTVSVSQLDNANFFGVLAVGAEEIANDGITPAYGNHFKGVVDDLQM